MFFGRPSATDEHLSILFICTNLLIDFEHLTLVSEKARVSGLVLLIRESKSGSLFCGRSALFGSFGI